MLVLSDIRFCIVRYHTFKTLLLRSTQLFKLERPRIGSVPGDACYKFVLLSPLRPTTSGNIVMSIGRSP